MLWLLRSVTFITCNVIIMLVLPLLYYARVYYEAIDNVQDNQLYLIVI